MVEKSETTKSAPKFAGIEVPPELNKNNFFFLFFNTFLAGLLMAVFGILQPAFLKDVIKINQDFAGSINGLLMNLNEIATLALVALVGALSDKVGRKILALLGFVVLALFFYLLGQANEIASFLQVPTGIASQVSALLSFAPSRSAEFTQFAPGLVITYVLRLFLGVGLILCYPQFITMVADYTYEKDRGKGMAMNGVMMALSSLLVFGLFVPIMGKIGVLAFIYIIIAVALGGALSTGLFLKDRLPEVKQEKVVILFGKAPPVMHGRAQEPLHTDHVQQCAHDSLSWSRRRCRVAHARLEVLADLRAVSNDDTVRCLDRRHRDPARPGRDVLEEPGCRRGDLSIRQPILDQVAARLAGVQRQRRAVERDRFLGHQDSPRSMDSRFTIFRQIVRRVR